MSDTLSDKNNSENEYLHKLLNNEVFEDENPINFKRYFLILFHYKWILLISIMVCVFVVILYSSGLSKDYKSSFNVYYDKTIADYVPNIKKNIGHNDFDKQYWARIMTSERLFSMVKETSGFTFNTKELSGFFSMTQGKKEDKIFNIQISVQDTSVILPLSMAYIESLNKLDALNYMTGFEKLIDYLNQQLRKNEKNLEDIENEISERNSWLNISELKGLEDVKRIYEDYKKQLNDAKIELSSVEAAKIKTKSELLSHQDNLMQEVSFTEPLKVQLMNLHVDLARSLTKYKDDHPIVKGIRNNITQVESMLQNGFSQNVEIKNLSANPLKSKLLSTLIKMETEEISLNAKILSIEKIVSELKEQLQPDSNTNGFSNLLRKRELILSTINLLNSKIIEAEASLQGKNSSFILIDKPIVPLSPSNKPFVFYLLIAFVGGAGLGVLVIIGLDFIDNRIKFVSDFEDYFSLPILGIMKHREVYNSIYEVVMKPLNEIGEEISFELAEIRINIQQLINRKSNKLIAVVSPSRKEGKTLCSFLVAQEMARVGKKVLLVDIDTYVPKLTNALGDADKRGIQDYLFEETTLESITQSTDFTNLSFIGAGQNNYNASIFYDTPRFDCFIEEVSREYDTIIFDTPALLYIPEIASFLNKIEGIIFIARINHTSRIAIDRVLKKTKGHSVQKIGAILTDVKLTPLESYYGDSYYYGNYKMPVNDLSKNGNRNSRKFTNALKAFVRTAEEKEPVDEDVSK